MGRPQLRARVAVPLAMLTAATIIVYLVFGRVGPFEDIRPPPPSDWMPTAADEVTLWSWQQGMAHYADGQYEDAASLFGRSVAGLAGFPEPTFYAGVCHALCEHPEVGEPLIHEAVDLRPEESRFRYYLAWTLALQDRHEDAAAHLRIAAEGSDRWAARARRTLRKLP